MDSDTIARATNSPCSGTWNDGIAEVPVSWLGRVLKNLTNRIRLAPGRQPAAAKTQRPTASAVGRENFELMMESTGAHHHDHLCLRPHVHRR